MLDIIMKPGNSRLSVNITVDMSSYCKACSDMRDQQELLLQQSMSKEDGGGDTAPIDSNIKSDFELERINALKKLTGIPGGLYWRNVKKMLSEQCHSDVPIENELAAAMSGDASMLPFAIRSLNDSFIELLKNSLDAMIKQYLEGVSLNTTLTMNVALEIQSPDIQVVITDNAGGFPNNYVHSFDNYLTNKLYKVKGTSEKSSYAMYYFGGSGLGMAMLCAMVKEGERLGEKDTTEKLYVVPEHTSPPIQIRNNQVTGGAEIRIISQLAPYRSVSPDLSLDPLDTSSSSGASFLRSVPSSRSISSMSSSSSGLVSDSSLFKKIDNAKDRFLAKRAKKDEKDISEVDTKSEKKIIKPGEK